MPPRIELHRGNPHLAAPRRCEVDEGDDPCTVDIRLGLHDAVKDAYAILKQGPQPFQEAIDQISQNRRPESRRQAAKAPYLREEDARRTISDLRELIRGLRAERDQLLRLATRDSLTGVWNRRAIFDLLAKALARARRDGRPVAVLMADIDGFKSINDRFGHSVGDAILRETAQRLCSCVRRSDEVGRYGGEEFLIVLPGCSGQAALARAEQFRAAVGGTSILFPGGQLRVTCSFGLHSVIEGNYDRDELMRKADAALYRAKRMGRNRVETADLN